MLAVTPESTVKTLKFEDDPPPQTVSDDAPGPVIVTFEPIVRPLLSVIVLVTPGSKRLESKVMVWLPPSVAALAIAWRKVVKPGVGESASVVTSRLNKLVRENDTVEAPGVATVTSYGPPAVPLAVAVTEAVPEAIVTGTDGLSVAEAPLAGGAKVTTPPSTGSPELFGVTVTCSAFGNAVLTSANWLLPAVTARVKPDDSKAPMSTVPPTTRGKSVPRWSVVMPEGIRALLPASMAGLPGSNAMVCVGPP